MRRTIRELTRARSLHEVGESLAACGEPYGLTQIFLAEIVLGQTRPEMVVFVDTMGEAWRRLYTSEKDAVEPLLDVIRTEQRLIQWSEMPTANLSDAQRAGFDRYAEMGFVDGLSIAIPGANGYYAWITATGDRPLNFSPRAREAIQHIATIALVQCRVLHARDRGPRKPGPELTAREADILYWVLEGKTDDEIGVIVGLTRATVKFHLHNAILKLDAANRITAAVRALKGGLLLPPLTRNAVVIPAATRNPKT